MDELHGLVKTAGARIVGTLVQIREHPHPATCLGPGKLLELKQLVNMHDAELVVFDNTLRRLRGERSRKNSKRSSWTATK